MELTPAETRVLGCLIEKERTTPENYPLSLHSLVAACNQLTNREPTMTLGDREVEEALDTLRQKKLATVIFGAGSRVQKYRHILPDIYNFTPRESALLCVLLLRGPQTAGELRQRAERMAPLATLTEAEGVLESMAGGDEPLVRMLAARPGQKGAALRPTPLGPARRASRRRAHAGTGRWRGGTPGVSQARSDGRGNCGFAR